MLQFVKVYQYLLNPNTSGYFVDADINLSKYGVSRISILVENSIYSIKNELANYNPIFKICVPTIISYSSYIDYHCPLSKCTNTYEESKTCKLDYSFASQFINMKFDYD